MDGQDTKRRQQIFRLFRCRNGGHVSDVSAAALDYFVIVWTTVLPLLMTVVV